MGYLQVNLTRQQTCKVNMKAAWASDSYVYHPEGLDVNRFNIPIKSIHSICPIYAKIGVIF